MNGRGNEADASPPADEQRLLDLLVDGELRDAERRQLLASFDARPNGWRRCALAFLEQQAFARELSAIAQSGQDVKSFGRPASPDHESAIAPLSTLSVNSSPRHAPWLVLAMAATFLMAFGLGWITRQPGQHPMTDDGSANMPAIGALADASLTSGSNVGESPLAAEQWDTVTLVMDGGTRGKREVELPVVESTADDDAWLDRRDPLVPAELRDALERLGHEVEERRQFLPLNLEDGRQVIVPVDEIEFRPVSHVYQ